MSLQYRASAWGTGLQTQAPEIFVPALATRWAITASSVGRAGSEADNAPPSFRVLKLLFSTFAPDCSLPTKPAFGNPGPVQGAHAAEISERLTYG